MPQCCKENTAHFTNSTIKHCIAALSNISLYIFYQLTEDRGSDSKWPDNPTFVATCALLTNSLELFTKIVTDLLYLCCSPIRFVVLLTIDTHRYSNYVCAMKLQWTTWKCSWIPMKYHSTRTLIFLGILSMKWNAINEFHGISIYYETEGRCFYG